MDVHTAKAAWAFIAAPHKCTLNLADLVEWAAVITLAGQQEVQSLQPQKPMPQPLGFSELHSTLAELQRTPGMYVDR
jgi:hypothetical protein